MYTQRGAVEVVCVDSSQRLFQASVKKKPGLFTIFLCLFHVQGVLMGIGAFGLHGLLVQPHVVKATSHVSVSATTLRHKRGEEGARAAPGKHNLATILSAPVSLRALMHKYRVHCSS